VVTRKRSIPKKGAPLSDREEQVARRVPTMSTQEIADDLEVSYDMIKLHLSRIRSKLGFQRTTQIAAWAALNLLEGD
jgi:DNA-binding CsgD family transcriptional regulator